MHILLSVHLSSWLPILWFLLLLSLSSFIAFNYHYHRITCSFVNFNSKATIPQFFCLHLSPYHDNQLSLLFFLIQYNANAISIHSLLSVFFHTLISSLFSFPVFDVSDSCKGCVCLSFCLDLETYILQLNDCMRRFIFLATSVFIF